MKKENKIAICGPTKFSADEQISNIPPLAEYLDSLRNGSNVKMYAGGTAGFPHELAKAVLEQKNQNYTRTGELFLTAYTFCSGEKEEEMIKLGVMPSDSTSVYHRIIIPEVRIDDEKMTGIWDIAAVRMVPLISGKNAVIAYVNSESRGTMVELGITGVYKTPTVVLAPEEIGYRRASNLAEIFGNINVTRNPEETTSVLEKILNKDR